MGAAAAARDSVAHHNTTTDQPPVGYSEARRLATGTSMIDTPHTTSTISPNASTSMCVFAPLLALGGLLCIRCLRKRNLSRRPMILPRYHDDLPAFDTTLPKH